MARGRPWTVTEDAIIRENAMFGPSWNGFELLLPGRTPNAIAARRKALGVQFERGIAKGTARLRRPQKAAPRPTLQRRGTVEYETSWTQGEVEALVRTVRYMVDATGHSPAECFVELSHLVRAYEAAGRRV